MNIQLKKESNVLGPRTPLDLGVLKVELLCLGARPQPELGLSRKGGAGPAGGQYFELPNGNLANVPLTGKFIQGSPFEIKHDEEIGAWNLYKGGEFLCELYRVPDPLFYQRETSDNIPMWKVALAHGWDCLATTVDQSCIYWRGGFQCKFCAIERSLTYNSTILRKTPQQLAEVILAAREENRGGHMTLTTGSQPGRDKGVKMMAETVKGIKARVDIPLHVQFEPIDPQHLRALADAGTDTVGIHVETFDEEIFKKICPGKARTKIENYEKNWRAAVEIFGSNQVSSYIIIGLGETDDTVIEGCEKLASIGVIPYLVPLRPIPNTALEDWPPPSPGRMLNLYRKLTEILRRNNLSLRQHKAGCAKCGCCSAAGEELEGPGPVL